MSKADKTISTLARSLDRHLSEMGMGHRELVELACALLDHAAARVSEEDYSASSAPIS